MAARAACCPPAMGMQPAAFPRGVSGTVASLSARPDAKHVAIMAWSTSPSSRLAGMAAAATMSESSSVSSAASGPVPASTSPRSSGPGTASISPKAGAAAPKHQAGADPVQQPPGDVEEHAWIGGTNRPLLQPVMQGQQQQGKSKTRYPPSTPKAGNTEAAVLAIPTPDSQPLVDAGSLAEAQDSLLATVTGPKHPVDARSSRRVVNSLSAAAASSQPLVNAGTSRKVLGSLKAVALSQSPPLSNSGSTQQVVKELAQAAQYAQPLPNSITAVLSTLDSPRPATASAALPPLSTAPGPRKQPLPTAAASAAVAVLAIQHKAKAATPQAAAPTPMPAIPSAAAAEPPTTPPVPPRRFKLHGLSVAWEDGAAALAADQQYVQALREKVRC